MTSDGRLPRRWRRWSLAAKARIVAQASAPGARVALIAQRHAVSRAQIHAWCRDARAVRDAGEANALVPVVVDDAGALASTTTGEIEIALADEVRVRVRGGVDARALRAVLAALRG